jgi:zinc protease
MDDLRSFFRQYYAPNNASLAIVGNFDPAQAKALVQKYFGDIPRQPDVVVPNIPQPPLPGVVQETIQDQVAKVPRLDLGWVGVRQYDPDEPAGDVLAYILGSGKASRLYQELVQKRQIATEVDAGNDTMGQGGIFGITAVVKQGHTTKEIAPAIDQILEDVKKNGVTADEVDRAKRVIVAGALRGIERIGGFGGKADLLNRYQTYLGDPGYLSKDIARYRAVTPDAVKAFANKILSTDHRMILDIEPAGSSGSGATTGNAKGSK